MTARILGKIPGFLELTEYHYFEKYIELCSTERKLNHEESVKIIKEMLSIYNYGFLNPKASRLDYKLQSELILGSYRFDAIELHIAIFDFLARKNDCIAYVEQTPNNLLHYKQILKVKNSKMLALIRDPRFVLRSQKSKWKRSRLGSSGVSFSETLRAFLNYNPIITAVQWKINAKKLSRIIDEVAVDKLFFTKFEDVLKDPEDAVMRLCEFLEVEFSKEYLKVPHIGSSTISDKPENRGVKSQEPFLNNHSSRVISNAVSFICKNESKKFGYLSIVYLDMSLLSLFIYLSLIPFQLVLIVIFNIDRTENLLLSLKNRFRI
jgi:hypothetical protein